MFGNLLNIDQNNKVVSQVKRVEFDAETALYLGTDLAPQSTFWRKSVQEKTGLFNVKYIYRADYEFFLRMAISGPKFYFINDFFSLLYRIHPNQTSKSLFGMESERRIFLEDILAKISNLVL